MPSLKFKKERDSLMNASMNWDQLAQSANDAIKLKLRTRTTSVTTYDTIASKKIAPISKDQVKRNFIDKLLGRKKEVSAEVKLPSRVLAKTRTFTDSSYVTIKDTTYLGRLKQMYSVNRQKQIDTDNELTLRETRLIKMNGKMISQLMEIIGILKRAELVRQEAGTIAASNIGNRAIVIISFGGRIGLAYSYCFYIIYF